MPGPRLVLGVDDLSERSVARVLERARAWQLGEAAPPPRRVLGLLFLEPSLRTRAGFASAAARLGWPTIEVDARRDGPTSMPESWADTLRTFSGFVDVVVARPSTRLLEAELVRLVDVPLVNGGDVGPGAEHPSQALVDLYAIHRRGRVEDLVVAVCGDLRMRAVRSLLRLLARTPPRRLVLVSAPALDDPALPPGLAEVAERRTLADVGDVDVLYVAGMPHGCLPEPERALLRVTGEVVERVPADAIVLSPLPLLDEMDADARNDPRVQMFAQSADGVAVRMALLEELVGGSELR